MRPIVAVRDIERRLPEHGRIRFGEKGSKGQPVKLDRFRFTSHDEGAVRQLAELYGGSVEVWPEMAGQWQLTSDASEIPVVLPPDPLGGTPIYELWSGGGVQRRCDGEICLVPRHTQAGAELVEEPCICSTKQALECKPKTRLTVILPEIRFGGGWRIESGGWNVAHELPGMVDMIQALQQRGMMRATLALEARTSKFAGKTRQFMVPVLRPAVSLDAIAAGEGSVLALGKAPTLEGVQGVSGGGFDAVAEGQPTDPSSLHPTTIDTDIVDAEIVEPEVAAFDLDRRRKKMHALLRELGMGVTERHALVRRITNGTHESSNELDLSGLDVMLAALEAMKKAEAFFDGVDAHGMAVVSRR